MYKTLSTKTLQNEKLIVFNRRYPGNRMDIWIFRVSRWRGPYSHSFSNCYNCFTFRGYQKGLTF
jgi:hypothetical protein